MSRSGLRDRLRGGRGKCAHPEVRCGICVCRAWPLEDWADRNPRNKPQLEALPDGRLIATDPVHSRLLLLSNDGRVTARLDTALDVPLFSPNGVAFDRERGFVYVTDGLAGHIRRFPFTDFALR